MRESGWLGRGLAAILVRSKVISPYHEVLEMPEQATDTPPSGPVTLPPSPARGSLPGPGGRDAPLPKWRWGEWNRKSSVSREARREGSAGTRRQRDRGWDRDRVRALGEAAAAWAAEGAAGASGLRGPRAGVGRKASVGCGAGGQWGGGRPGPWGHTGPG